MAKTNLPKKLTINNQLRKRFWDKAKTSSDSSKCWEWTASISRIGYGQFYAFSMVWSSHRFAWLLTYGYDSKICILHRCDNMKCVNPNHLFEGTQQDNMQDMVDKGRSISCGDSNKKLSLSQVNQIRVEDQKGISYKIICKKYGISRSHFYRIRNKEQWK